MVVQLHDKISLCVSGWFYSVILPKYIAVFTLRIAFKLKRTHSL
jgi:hypothetical protein